MPFKITITETRAVKKLVGKEWEIVGTREVAREPAFLDGNEASKTRIEEVRGYTPEIEKTFIESNEVYEQTVESLSLPEVIKAINGMSRKSRKPRK